MRSNSTHKPRVSILLPTHNRADVLPFAIRSVLAQTVQDFELLIVGDGCTDNTAEIIQAFSDPRVLWLDLPKAPGFGYANRNTALRSARGEYIAFMAHDDLWLCDHMEQLLPFFGDPKIEIVYSRPLWVIPRGMIVPGIFNLNHGLTMDAFFNRRNAIPASCFMHRRECFFKYGYWDDTLPDAADWDMWVRIIKGGGQGNFAYLTDSTCLHFKANWRDDSYDRTFGFPLWRRMFAAGLMPAGLKLDVTSSMTEQEFIWRAISSEPKEWNKKIRIAIQQVVDLCALQGNLVTEALLAFNDEFVSVSLPPDRSFGFDFLALLNAVKQMLVNQQLSGERASDELMDARKALTDTQTALADAQNTLLYIKNTLTWRLHEHFMGIELVRRVYLMIIMPIRRWREKIK